MGLRAAHEKLNLPGRGGRDRGGFCGPLWGPGGRGGGAEGGWGGGGGGGGAPVAGLQPRPAIRGSEGPLVLTWALP